MAHSAPSPTVQFVTLMDDKTPFETLLTKPVTKDFTWIAETLALGNLYFSPAKPLLLDRPNIAAEREYYDGLPVIEQDGFENLYEIASCGDGHNFYYGAKTKKFYALYHDPDEFAKVADNLPEFLKWAVTEWALCVKGCPWIVYLIPGPAHRQTYSSRGFDRRGVDPVVIFNKAKSDLNWSRIYTAPHGFSMINFTEGVRLDFYIEYEDEKSYVEFEIDHKHPDPMKCQRFIQWLQKQGVEINDL